MELYGSARVANKRLLMLRGNKKPPLSGLFLSRFPITFIDINFQIIAVFDWLNPNTRM